MKCPRCQSSSIVDRIQPPTSSTATHRNETPLSTRSQSSHLFRNTIGQLTARTPNLGMLAKHQSCPIPFQTPTSTDWSSLEDSGMFGMSVDSHLVTPASRSKSKNQSPVEFGQCTSKMCGFRFCVSCWCDYHGEEHNCTTIQESKQRHRKSEAVACSKQSKRNLRRLMVP